ncbi:MAG: phage regulatory protein/antirepressor Ant [Cycloclasticus sp.]|jgi:Uncharacterized phage-encoded protein
MSNLVNIPNLQTMSSREISELTGKEHRNVLPVCRSLVDQGVLKSSIPNIYTNQQNGQRYPEFLLDKRDSLVLVARLSPEFTASIVDRWQELENKAPKVPTSFIEAMELAITQAKQIEEQAPKIQYHDAVLATGNGLTTTEIATQLSMSAIKLNRMLESLKIQRKVGGRWLLTVSHLGQGLETEETYLDEDGKSRHSMKWTEKGRKYIHELLNE